jgi:hypothetical protein
VIVCANPELAKANITPLTKLRLLQEEKERNFVNFISILLILLFRKNCPNTEHTLKED